MAGRVCEPELELAWGAAAIGEVIKLAAADVLLTGTWSH